MKTKLAEKEHLAAHAEKLQIERDDLQQRVRDLEGENSEQQAKLLMSAFNNSSSGAGGLSSGLAGLSSLGSLSGKSGGTSGSTGDSDKLKQLERDNSQLTNENLKLQEENQSLSMKLQE